MKKFLFIVISGLVGIHPLTAQFDSQLSNYWAITNYYNPAYAGQTEDLQLTLISRLQWLGIENAPRTTILAAQMPYQFMGKVHGVGASMYNDRAGLFSVSVFSGQYAWKKKIAKGLFSAGLQVGYINQTFDGSKVEIPDNDEYHNPNDPAIPTSEVSGKSLDASLGVFYSKEKWFTGLSVTHLLYPKLELGENYTYEVPRTYYFTAGYNIQLNNPLLELRPTLLAKTVEMSSLYLDPDSLIEKVEGNMMKAMWRNAQLDVSVRMIYDKKFWGGLSWRNGDAMVLMLGAKFKMIEAGYAYDFPISKIIKESTGSHEVFIRYVMDMNLKKGIKNKHKSVRIL
ncbi:MAG: type IX secretion system membrane protein PorP/SprF [Dysgonamonadaceae bacterium]|jgi:type IX secretion system PorP/SprF family membrane protein|nr:type IX secretion system membrane protein PorP/SprF [Dysgonamonadaceae bacterium]